MALISDLTQRQYAAIGKVACEWAHVEDSLQWYFFALTKLNTEMGLKIVSELGSQTLLDMLLALAHDPNKNQLDQPPIYNAFFGIYPKIMELRGERNRADHANWNRTGRSRVATIYFQAKGKLIGHNIAKKTDELEALAQKICSLNLKLFEILRDYEADRLVASPPRPPKRSRQGSRSAQTGKARVRESRRRSSP